MKRPWRDAYHEHAWLDRPVTVLNETRAALASAGRGSLPEYACREEVSAWPSPHSHAAEQSNPRLLSLPNQRSRDVRGNVSIEVARLDCPTKPSAVSYR